MTTPLLWEQRLKCFKVLEEHFDLFWSMISHGGFRHGGEGPPELFEVFMEVCSILLFAGDVFGYVVVDEDGVVDPERSFGPFVQLLVQCLEITHVWCMKHPSGGQTPKNRRWLSNCGRRKVFYSAAPLLKLKMVKAVYPPISESSVMPEGTLIAKDARLRALFLNKSRLMMTMVEQGCHGQCEPLGFTRDIQSVEVFIMRRRVKEKTSEMDLTKVRSSFKDEEVLSVRLVPTFDASELCSERDQVFDAWELYWSFEAYAPHESLYEDIKEAMRSRGVQVS